MKFSTIAFFALMLASSRALPALEPETRHYFGLDTQAAFTLGFAEPQGNDGVFDANFGIKRLSFFFTYGPPYVWVRGRLGASVVQGDVFALSTGLDIPLYEKRLPNEQRLFAFCLFGDLCYNMSDPFRLSFYGGAYVSVTPAMNGVSIGLGIDDQARISPYVSYAGTYYAGRK